MMIQLNNKQKEAVAALLSELFNAENIVEINKLKLLNQKLLEYGISSNTIKNAKCITLEKAVLSISSIEDNGIKADLLNDFEMIARCDGYCSPDEAILLQAIKMAILPPEGKDSVDALIFSMRRNKLNFDGKKATYIHPDKNLVAQDEQDQIDKFADKIKKHLDELVLLFYCFGYDFVYIPKLREDFGKNPQLMEELKNFSFFFSNLPKECVEEAITTFGLSNDSRRFTTAKFANMLFSGREDDVSTDHDTPAFLIKISDSYVINEKYIHNGNKETKHSKMYNFLYLPIVADGISGIIDTAKNFFQNYIDMVDKTIYPVCPEPTKRLRHFDLYQSLIARIAKEGVVKASPSITLDISHKDEEKLLFEKAIEGEDVFVPLKSYIIEYTFALWCTEKATMLECMKPSDVRLVSKEIWSFIKNEFKGERSDDYITFKKEYSRNCYNIRQSLMRKRLSHYVCNINDYFPIKTTTSDDGPAYYRIATRGIRVIENLNFSDDSPRKGVLFAESSICQKINDLFVEIVKSKQILDIQL